MAGRPQEPSAAVQVRQVRPLWLAQPSRGHDLQVGFRASFELSEPALVSLELLGASWFRAYLDGEFLADGPARFPASHPEFSTRTVELSAGSHVLAVQVHAYGVVTRLMPAIEGFLHCVVKAGDRDVPLDWRSAELPGYLPTGRRVSPLYGWIEWCDTRALGDWTDVDFDAGSWQPPVPVDRGLGALRPLSSGEVDYFRHSLSATDTGRYLELLPILDLDDPPVRFFHRDLAPTTDIDGCWRRYDLGRIRIGTPRFVLDLPAGTFVEFGGAEYLTAGRVAPHLRGSTGPSCTVDHFIARGGPQEFRPLTPKGVRYLEVHLDCDPAKARFEVEEYVERGYFAEPEGRLETPDPLLSRIWTTGIETLRACAEDAIVDCPSRERGQWLGDLLIAMEIVSVGYADLRLIRRGLYQAAYCADERGIMPGLYPGTCDGVFTYALMWPSGVWRYHQLTGEGQLLTDLLPAARRLADFVVSRVTPQGIGREDLPWIYVDWAYFAPPGPTDMAVNLTAIAGLRDLLRWGEAIGATDRLADVGTALAVLEAYFAEWFAEQCADPDSDGGWDTVGFQCTTLALRLGLLEKCQWQATRFLKRYILHSFPNSTEQARVTNLPGVFSAKPVNPYFTNFSHPELIKRNEMEFVLDQYRRCWGWMLDLGLTTWLESFEDRVSHAHQWSGGPTWQLSRYLLGLHPRFDRGLRTFDLDVRPGWLDQASGRIPVPGGAPVEVCWKRRADGHLDYELNSREPLTVRFRGAEIAVRGTWRGQI